MTTLQVIYEFAMFVTWITFGYKHWNSIHKELGRSAIWSGRHPTCLIAVIVNVGYSRRQLSIET